MTLQSSGYCSSKAALSASAMICSLDFSFAEMSLRSKLSACPLLSSFVSLADVSAGEAFGLEFLLAGFLLGFAAFFSLFSELWAFSSAG